MSKQPIPKSVSTIPDRQLLVETGILYKHFTLGDHVSASVYQGNRMTEYRLESTEGNRLHWSKGEQGTITICGKTYPLTEANLFFTRHNEPVSYAKEPTGNAEVFVLIFDDFIKFPEGRRIFTPIDSIFVYAETLRLALLKSQKQYDTRGVTNLIEQELLNNQFKDTRVSSACDSLASQLVNPQAIAHIPQQLSLSGSQFRRIFKRDLGMSPTEWHLAARLSFAHYLLRGTNLPFQTVAAKCGFASYPTFARLFKAHYNYSPNYARSR
ncbi:MAG: helix-turn-helix domain-containing protein [Fimbriimonadaceae bacterium]